MPSLHSVLIRHFTIPIFFLKKTTTLFPLHQSPTPRRRRRKPLLNLPLSLSLWLSPMGGEPQFDRQSSSSFTQRLRSSYLCFSCCFNGSNGENEAPAASLLRSSSVWIRDKARGIPAMVSKFNRNRKVSGDFRYDPISYALNFDGGEDDADVAQEERLRFKNFSSRLPASPSVQLEERPSSSAIRPF